MRRRRTDRAEQYRSVEYVELTSRLVRSLRGLRRARGWTQEEAADRSRIATQLYQRLEAGTTNATLTTLARLCAGFQVDVKALFCVGEGSNASPSRSCVTSLHGSRGSNPLRLFVSSRS